MARVWQLAVGRNTLLLLDSNVEGNRPEDRELTARLYGGDERVRIRQELLLGVGAVRALAAMGIVPGVLHLNEGHSAFATLELVRQRMEREGVDAWEAIRRVSPQVVFTTHTPVPAGHDCFSARAHRRTSRTAAGIAGTLPDALMGLGRARAGHRRGVLHDGAGAQDLPPRQRRLIAPWRGLAGDVAHALSRSHRGPRPDRSYHQRRPRPELAGAADAAGHHRHLGPDWPHHVGDPGFWERVDAIDDGELWETHQTLKTQLIEIARRRAAHQAESQRRGAGLVGAHCAGR